VIAEAIALADAEGLAALSMPKLARRLGVGTMTLYGYVAGKGDLLDRMAATMLGPLRPADAGAWSERTRLYFWSLRTAARRHPALAALLAAGRIDAGNLRAHLDALLDAAPVDADRAASARALLAALAFTTGTISWETAVPRAGSAGVQVENGAGASPDPRRMGVAAIPPGEGSTPSDEQFEWGLNALLGAI
jgi:AcrR family transcriptional regulator